MITKHSLQHLIWIDVESPSEEEMKELAGQYGIHPVVAHEMMTPSVKPKADLYADFIFAILHFPSGTRNGKSIREEVDFLIGKECMITVRYGHIDAIAEYAKAIEVNSILAKEHGRTHAGFLFLDLVERLYAPAKRETDHIRRALEEMEEELHAGDERKAVLKLSVIKRDIIRLRHALTLHKEVLSSIVRASERFFGTDFTPYISAIIDDYYKIRLAAKADNEYASELRDAGDSLLSTRQTETLRLFTVMAFLTFPLSLAVMVLEFDSPHNPIKGTPQDFWIVLGILAGMLVCMLGFFRYKKWL